MADENAHRSGNITGPFTNANGSTVLQPLQNGTKRQSASQSAQQSAGGTQSTPRQTDTNFQGPGPIMSTGFVFNSTITPAQTGSLPTSGSNPFTFAPSSTSTPLPSEQTGKHLGEKAQQPPVNNTPSTQAAVTQKPSTVQAQRNTGNLQPNGQTQSHGIKSRAAAVVPADPCADTPPLFEIDIESIEKAPVGGTTTVVFSKPSFLRAMIRSLNFLQKKKILVDIVLISSDNKEKFDFHGLLLASASSMFRQWLSGFQVQFCKGTVQPGATSILINRLHDFIYNPELFLRTVTDTKALSEFVEFFHLEDLLGSNVWIDPYCADNPVLNNLCQFLEQRIFTYTVLKINEEEFPCHAALLLAVAPGFTELSDQGRYQELYDSISLTCKVKTIDAFLTFIYDQYFIVEDDFAQDALLTYCKWNVPCLILAVCEHLGDNLGHENAADVYLTALKAVATNKHTACTTLLEKTFKFIELNAKVIMMTDTFVKKLTEDQVHMFISKFVMKTLPKDDAMRSVVAWYNHGADRLAGMGRLISVISLLCDGPAVGIKLKQAAKLNEKFARLISIANTLSTTKDG